MISPALAARFVAGTCSCCLAHAQVTFACLTPELPHHHCPAPCHPACLPAAAGPHTPPHPLPCLPACLQTYLGLAFAPLHTTTTAHLLHCLPTCLYLPPCLLPALPAGLTLVFSLPPAPYHPCRLTVITLCLTCTPALACLPYPCLPAGFTCLNLPYPTPYALPAFAFAQVVALTLLLTCR